MRFAIMFLLFSSSAFAQNHSAAPAVPASCGSVVAPRPPFPLPAVQLLPNST